MRSREEAGQSQMESSVKVFEVEVMESAMESSIIPEILQAAIEERPRLEAKLRSNPDFQRLEAARRIIAAYAPGAEGPVPIYPIQFSEPAGSAVRAAPTSNPDPSPTDSFSGAPMPFDPLPTSNSCSSPSIPSGPQPTSRNGLWTQHDP